MAYDDWLEWLTGHENCTSDMSSQPLPNQQSIASLLWEVLRLAAHTLFGTLTGPVRPLVERQQVLAVLGLPPNATRQQIKRRYRVLAKKHHPDRGGDRLVMRRIIATYEWLMKDQEPLFHMSLGLKELFHSNYLAWFADYFPESAAAVFHPWAVPMIEAQAGRSEREPAHLDLVLHLPGLAPIAVDDRHLAKGSD